MITYDHNQCRQLELSPKDVQFTVELYHKDSLIPVRRTHSFLEGFLGMLFDPYVPKGVYLYATHSFNSYFLLFLKTI